MRAVDTNVLVRLITRDDARQAATADAFVEKGAWVSVLALAESTWVLATVYKLNAASLATAIEMLLNHEDLTLQDADAVAAALDLFRARPSLGFSDCLMLQLARKAGHLPLGTFDRGLGGGAGGAACLLLRPTAPTRHAAARPRSKPARDRG
jgi:predicted nucleic-acid-binding protein